jgi:hypothetical protein
VGKRGTSNLAESVVVAARATRANPTIRFTNVATRAAAIVEALDFKALVAAAPVVDGALDFFRFLGIAMICQLIERLLKRVDGWWEASCSVCFMRRVRTVKPRLMQ